MRPDQRMPAHRLTAQTPVTAKPRLAPHRRFVELVRPDQSRPGLYADEPEVCRREWKQFLPALIQLGLMLAIFHIFRVEGRAFRLLITLALVALPTHYMLPFRWKKPAFLGLSLIALVSVLGIELGGAVLAISTLLIGITILPVSWGLRASLLAGLGLIFGLLRNSPSVGFLPDGTWTMVGTMFMFRILIYLYEIKHEKGPESLLDTMSYFFLPPNYCFLHFPVVDYRTLQRGYFSRDINGIIDTGLGMMFKGTTHLLLYRIIYHDLLVAPNEVRGVVGLSAYLVCNYLLYLRVSGQFHMACGMLHLFGFALPETHHNYLLATSFTDYWRRINIYWKDFMVRVIFNPVAFRLKRKPQWQSLAAATFAVFVATWALHAYQSFWLRGTWGITVTDTLFWGILGLFVMVNVQFDARRKPVDRNAKFTLKSLSIRVAKTSMTFVAIVMLWSLWSSPSLSAWLNLMSKAFVLESLDLSWISERAADLAGGLQRMGTSA